VTTVVNPATEETIAELPAAGVEETDAAVAAAKAAFPAWRAIAPSDRARPAPAARRARRGARRGARAARDAQRRQADRGFARRGRDGGIRRTSSSRTPISKRLRPARRTRPSATRARIAAPGRGSSSSRAPTTGSSTCSSARRGRSASATPRRLPTEMGPLVSAGQRESVSSYVDGNVAYQGNTPEGRGFWFPSTVLAPMSNDDRARERRSSGRSWP
jgi:hypothetical protein